MARNTAKTADWERQRDMIFQLYVTEDRALKDVIALMAERHGFKKTKAQYEGALKRWKWRKNLTAKEWEVVAHKTQKRKARDAELEVREVDVEIRIQGIMIPSKKVKTETHRYNYQSTFEKFRKVYYRPASPETPPGITIAFPSPTQSARSLSVFRSPPSLHESCFHWSRLTPWGQFLDFVEILRQSASRNLLYIPQTPTSSASKAPVHLAKDVLGDTSELVELILRQPEDGLQQFVNDITETLFFNFEHDMQQISLKSISSNAFLPPDGERGSEIDVMAVLDLTQRRSQLEFLKLAVALISNNLPSHRAISALVDLYQDARNLAVLQQLLDQDLPSINAVAEKLLGSAAYHGNLELISLLVENGLDADSKGIALTSMESRSPLEFAIHTSQEGSGQAIVKYLLDHGADPNQKVIWYHKGGFPYAFSMLDFAVFQGDRTIVEELLNPRPGSYHPPPVISLETICYSTKHERPCVLDLLVKRAWPLHIPLKIDRSDQCQIIEMAAFHGKLEVIKYLLRRGFDINSCDTDGGYGSALVAAVFQGHTEVVDYLLSRSAGVDGIGLARGYSCIPLSQSYYGFTALQASLMRNHTKIARKLILSGADPNYYGERIYCTVAPIKLASRFCDVATVQLLLQNGADPNAPDIPRSSNLCRPILSDWAILDLELREKVGGLEMRTALQIAFERGSAESVAIAQILIQSGANLPLPNNTEVWDSLLSAFVGGERQIVDLVLLRGDSIPDAQKYLQACLESGKSNLARGLINDQIFHLGRDTCSPGVICAAILKRTTQEDPSFAHFLLSGTIEALGHLPMDFGSAALAAAARTKAADLIETLLTAGARPCVQCEEISSVLRCDPLLYSMNAFDAYFFHKGWFADYDPCLQDVKTSINLLIDACSSSNHRSFGQYYCHHALEVAFLKASCGYWDYHEQLARSVLQSLAISGVDVNYHSERLTSCSALQMCMNHGICGNVAEYLLEVGADANCEARMAESDLHSIPSIFGPSPLPVLILSYATPLQVASRANDVPLLKLLIQHGAEVNAKPAYERGATALQYAAITGNFEILNILLKAGANINAPRSQYEGRTAIEGAAEHGHLDMVCYLLEAGADVRGRGNGQYRRSVYRAWNEHHRTLARVIQEFKARRFGPGDVCDIEEIVSSMTTSELEGEPRSIHGESEVVDDYGEDLESGLESDEVEN